jgi:hypothetical protein
MGVEQQVDKQVNAGCVAAAGLWIGAFFLWVVAYTQHDPGLGQLSIIVTAAGATLTVRCFFIEQTKRLKNVLVVTRHESPVRTLH